MNLRKWIGHGPEITITLTEQPAGEARQKRLHRAIQAFVEALAAPEPILAGDMVECVDAWDTFNNLTVGKLYGVVKVDRGMIFVCGDHGHIGGWWRSLFKQTEASACPPSP